MADNNEHEELIDYDEEEVRAILIDWLINWLIHSCHWNGTNESNAAVCFIYSGRWIQGSALPALRHTSHQLYYTILYYTHHWFLSFLQVDENVTAEKPQAADDGKEVKKWVY
jgi:hypothetical protein